MVAIDYSALTEGVSWQEGRQFRRESADRVFYSDPRLLAVQIVVFAFVCLLALSFIMSLFSGSSGIYSGPNFLLIVMGLGIGFLIAVRYITLHTKWARLLRLSRFASANGLEFSATGLAPSYPGMIFNVGSARRVPERITRPSDPFFDFGNLTYTTGSGKNKKVHNWSYVALKLDRMLPQIVLDAKSNHFLFSNLPSASRATRCYHWRVISIVTSLSTAHGATSVTHYMCSPRTSWRGSLMKRVGSMSRSSMTGSFFIRADNVTSLKRRTLRRCSRSSTPSAQKLWTALSATRIRMLRMQHPPGRQTVHSRRECPPTRLRHTGGGSAREFPSVA